jgi:hypothetical protein
LAARVALPVMALKSAVVQALKRLVVVWERP